MNNAYIFEYLDENDFRKKERSVRKYNMLAYKKLTFNYYPELRKGNFLGKEVNRNEKNSKVCLYYCYYYIVFVGCSTSCSAIGSCASCALSTCAFIPFRLLI